MQHMICELLDYSNAASCEIKLQKMMTIRVVGKRAAANFYMKNITYHQM